MRQLSEHRDQVVQAAAAGKHVLVEKPMALSTAECDAMIDACRAEGQPRSHTTARYTAPAQAAHQLIADGRIGEMKMLQLNWLEAGYSPATPEGENSWVSTARP